MVRFTRKRGRTYKKNKLRRRHRGGGEEKCIFINLMGGEGLGNQLYIYAAGLMVKRKSKLPLCIIPSSGNPHSKDDYTRLFDGKRIDPASPQSERIAAAKTVLNTGTSMNKWSNANIKYTDTNIGKNIKIKDTLYQNYSAIQPVIQEVKDSLMKNEFNKDEYKNYRDSTKSDESAFMHVRRGDYAGTAWELAIDYFFKGLDELEKNQSIKKLYIISNDIEWCKSHDAEWKKHFTKEIEYDGTPKELEALYRMILCTAGAIISGSTFSSWGAILGPDTNPKSTLVYPLIVHQYAGVENPFSFPPRWTGIKL